MNRKSSSNVQNVKYQLPTQYRQEFHREPLSRHAGRNQHRVRYQLPSLLNKPDYYRQRTTWRIDWVGSIIGTIILTASVAVAGPIGFVVGIALWWFILSLRR